MLTNLNKKMTNLEPYAISKIWIFIISNWKLVDKISDIHL